MTPEEREARLTALRAKLSAREGNPIYRDNVKALRAEIDRLEAERGS